MWARRVFPASGWLCADVRELGGYRGGELLFDEAGHVLLLSQDHPQLAGGVFVPLLLGRLDKRLIRGDLEMLGGVISNRIFTIVSLTGRLITACAIRARRHHGLYRRGRAAQTFQATLDDGRVLAGSSRCWLILACTFGSSAASSACRFNTSARAYSIA
jgi:hypothetical protein